MSIRLVNPIVVTRPKMLDLDAARYIAAVEAYDGQELEGTVKLAINSFVVGCKEDLIWSAIKASCILAGARTLEGALVPLVGPSPTNVNGLFVGADYNRKIGLIGDGTKLIDSNRNNNADPQNSHHLCVRITTAATGGQGNFGIIGTGGVVQMGGESVIGFADFAGHYFIRSRTIASIDGSSAMKLAGTHAISRFSSSSVNVLLPGFASSVSLASEPPRNATIKVFGRDVTPYFNGRIAFYSIGESLDLALLDARVTTLIAAIGAAIP